jgi:hypothetical protein
MRQILTVFGFALVLGATACAPGPADLCDPLCDCEGCSSREYDRCIDDWFEDEDEAADRRCSPEFEELAACQEATWQCRDGDFETDCGAERRALERCID